MNVIPHVACPSCSGRLMYNGNYFCMDCSWVMESHFLVERRSDFDLDVIVNYMTSERDRAILSGNRNYAERMEFYLKPIRHEQKIRRCVEDGTAVPDSDPEECWYALHDGWVS